MAADDYNHGVGPMGELLGLPCVTASRSWSWRAGKGSRSGKIEGGVEVVEFALPAVLDGGEGLNTPRYRP